jgi:hypothetical protein
MVSFLQPLGEFLGNPHLVYIYIYIYGFFFFFFDMFTQEKGGKNLVYI